MAKTNSGIAAPLIGIFLALAIFGGLAYYVVMGPPSTIKKGEVTSEAVKTENSEGTKQIVSVPEAKPGQGEVEFTSSSREVNSKEDPVVFAINEFLKATKISGNAKLSSAIVNGDNVVLDFDGMFVRGYGTDDEQTLIEGILKAVRDNSKAKTATFMERGKPARSLGNIELDGPQSVR